MVDVNANIDPALVVNRDDCNLNTYEAFVMPGKWINPGGYGVTGISGGTSAPTCAIQAPSFVPDYSCGTG